MKITNEQLARTYAKKHLSVDPAVVEAFYLPEGATDNEIRLVYINDLIPEWMGDQLEPFDFGIDREAEPAHRLLVLDVTPKQWEEIKNGSLLLPNHWTTNSAISLGKRKEAV